MLSAVIPSTLSYPAVPLARQQVHQWCVHPGPLVLGTGPFNSPTPTEDRDQTVSRRFKPIEVPNRIVDVNSWMRSACYPRRTFYPMSDGPSIRDHRITSAYFRTCSRCLSCSQAPLCVCTRRLVSNQPEGTFACLRYSLGGDRPSQTTHQTLSSRWVTAAS